MAHVPQETSADQFQEYVASLTADNGLGFSDADLTIKGRKYNETLHVSIECIGTTLAHVLVDTGSSLNVLPKKELDRLDCEGLTLKPSVVPQNFPSHILQNLPSQSFKNLPKGCTVQGPPNSQKLGFWF